MRYATARSVLCVLLSLWIASSASAVTIAWTPIGNPGNPADSQVMSDGTTGYGSVPYAYFMGTYEVSNAQYAEFLTAKAASDPYGLYHPSMAFVGLNGGITRSGVSGSYTYTATPGLHNWPVNYVTFYDALRFANWMNNGQGNGDTETGAYTITAQGISSNSITRNVGATIVLPSENEWYKAAYYDPSSATYYDYPAGSDTQTTCGTPGPTPNTANCSSWFFHPLAVGSYTGSASPNGTFDQGGNVWEWNEAIPGFGLRGQRGGGSFGNIFAVQDLWARTRGVAAATDEILDRGFRIAMIPEPSTGSLLIIGLLGLAGRRRMRT